MQTQHVFLNSQLLPLAEARIPLDDRGFRFGDGVFETMRLVRGAPYAWERHMIRLQSGLSALKIPADITTLRHDANKLIEHNHATDGFLRITITRGSGSQGYLPTYASPPTILIETLPPRPMPAASVTLWLSSYQKPSLAALPGNTKLMQGVNSTLARLEAQEHDCFEALLLNAQGEIAETSSANIFWYKNNTLYTPSLACGGVAGIMRDTVLRLSPYPIQEGRFDLSALAQSDSVFLTNIAWLAVPVASLQPHGMHWTNSEVGETIKRRIEEKMGI